MRDAGRHLANGGETRHMGEAFLEPVCLFLRAAAERDVLDEAHEAGRVGSLNRTDR